MTSKYLIFLMALGLISCQSKFEEKVNSGVPVNNESAVELKSTNQSFLEMNRRAQEIIDAVSYSVDQIKMGSRQLNSASAVVGLILEASSVAHSKNPKSETYVADSELMLPVGLTSEVCRLIKIHSEIVRADQNITQTVSVNSCKTNGTMIEVLKVVTELSDHKISVLSQTDYSNILPDTDAGNFLSTQDCSLKKDGSEIIEISCQAADLKISDNEKVHFNEVSYKKDRDPEFVLQASLFKGSEKKDSYLVEISKDGKIFTKVIQEQK